MSNRMKLSKNVSTQLESLSSKLDLRRNIICRMAIGESLIIRDSVKDYRPEDITGFEFNRYTLTGEYDLIFKALITQHEKKKINDRDYILIYLRNHIERGVKLLYKEYEKINSPIDFISYLLKRNI